MFTGPSQAVIRSFDEISSETRCIHQPTMESEEDSCQGSEEEEGNDEEGNMPMTRPPSPTNLTNVMNKVGITDSEEQAEILMRFFKIINLLVKKQINEVGWKKEKGKQ